MQRPQVFFSFVTCNSFPAHSTIIFPPNHPSQPLKKAANFRRRNASEESTAHFSSFARYAKKRFFLSLAVSARWMSFCRELECATGKNVLFSFNIQNERWNTSVTLKSGNGTGTRFWRKKKKRTRSCWQDQGYRYWPRNAGEVRGQVPEWPLSNSILHRINCHNGPRISSLTMPETLRGQFSRGKIPLICGRSARKFAKWYTHLPT